MDRRTPVAAGLTIAGINARNVAPATIAMTKIQGSRDARLARTVALIAICLDPLFRESIARSVTPKAGAVARCFYKCSPLAPVPLLQRHWRGAKESVLHWLPGSPAHAARLPELAPCLQDVPPSVVDSCSRRTRARIRSAPVRDASDGAYLPGRPEWLPSREVRVLAAILKVHRCSAFPTDP